MNSRSSKSCLLHAQYLSQLASVDKSDNPCDKISIENKKKGLKTNNTTALNSGNESAIMPFNDF